MIFFILSYFPCSCQAGAKFWLAGAAELVPQPPGRACDRAIFLARNKYNRLAGTPPGRLLIQQYHRWVVSCSAQPKPTLWRFKISQENFNQEDKENKSDIFSNKFKWRVLDKTFCEVFLEEVYHQLYSLWPFFPQNPRKFLFLVAQQLYRQVCVFIFFFLYLTTKATDKLTN